DMRYANGAHGRLLASQVAAGYLNDLRLRIIGSRASLSFHQQQPEQLIIHPQGANSYTVTRNGPDNKDATRALCRTPAGHPEGYLEGFAQIYREAAQVIRGESDAPLLPGIEAGIAGMKFIETVKASSARGGEWLAW
ncbi:MAG TPA: oxidoreductase, partial [Enterobacteriaceae bacterium]|nr:oxidoreductase [Enterobacteriaceae bacterium]